MGTSSGSRSGEASLDARRRETTIAVSMHTTAATTSHRHRPARRCPCCCPCPDWSDGELGAAVGAVVPPTCFLRKVSTELATVGT